MDYARIDKPFSHPSGGGFSPGKLRAMLLGVEKKRKEEEELEALDDYRLTGVAATEACRNVDVVTDLGECSTSIDSGRDHQLGSSIASESVQSSAFEFHRTDQRALHHRPALMSPFSKPAPSKWDDAQKWIASPTASRPGKGGFGGGGGGGGGGVQHKRLGVLGGGARSSAAKVVVECNDGVDTKGVDLSIGRKEGDLQKAVSWVPELYSVVETPAKPPLIAENSISDSAINLSRHDSSACVQSATTFVTPPPTSTSVSMRDVGTEMTPIASQEPSRTATPVRATTPMRSLNSSQPSTPRRAAQNSDPIESVDCHGGSSNTELSEKDLQMRTRKEIMILGTKLGKPNIAAWAGKEEEEIDESSSLKIAPVSQTSKSVIEARASTWEEAEKAKYLARFKREEIKIQAWENHQKAKTEAEMRKIEVDVEKMRAQAHDKLMNKLAATRLKAEEKRMAAEAKRNQQAAKTAQEVEYIRRTGRIPSSFSCWGLCS
ncbi:Remorin C-terminal protein [Dioscorea alata]|uniref:Remorin C-terminal protein n=2 Tax=Dioscorea alata TaxID=55571 RepID=A0ACB7TZ82_DIOAL|nr:Remorin C-terminal protein [Dioscorea alata]